MHKHDQQWSVPGQAVIVWAPCMLDVGANQPLRSLCRAGSYTECHQGLLRCMVMAHAVDTMHEAWLCRALRLPLK